MPNSCLRGGQRFGVPKLNIANNEIKQAESAVVDPTEELNPAEQVHKWTLSLDWAVQSPDGRLHFLHIWNADRFCLGAGIYKILNIIKYFTWKRNRKHGEVRNRHT